MVKKKVTDYVEPQQKADEAFSSITRPKPKLQSRDYVNLLLTTLIVFAITELGKLIFSLLFGSATLWDQLAYIPAAIIGGLVLVRFWTKKHPKPGPTPTWRLSFSIILLSALLINIYDFGIPLLNPQSMDSLLYASGGRSLLIFTYVLSFLQDLALLLPLYFTALIRLHYKLKQYTKKTKAEFQPRTTVEPLLLYRKIYTFKHILLISAATAIIAAVFAFALPFALHCEELECITAFFLPIPFFIYFGFGTIILLLIPYLSIIKTERSIFRHILFIIGVIVSYLVGTVFGLLLASLFNPMASFLVGPFIKQFYYLPLFYAIIGTAILYALIKKKFSGKTLLLYFIVIGIITPVILTGFGATLFANNPQALVVISEIQTQLNQAEKVAENITRDAIETHNIALCQQIKVSHKRQSCVVTFTYNEAIASLNLSQCEKLTVGLKEGCIDIVKVTKSAIEKKDPEICKTSEFSSSTPLCFKDLAITLNDKTLCDRLYNYPDVRTECLAVILNDKNLCNNIENPYTRSIGCLSKFNPK